MGARSSNVRCASALVVSLALSGCAAQTIRPATRGGDVSELRSEARSAALPGSDQTESARAVNEIARRPRATEWIGMTHLYALSRSVDESSRIILAEVATAMHGSARAVGLRLRAVVAARSSCANGLEPGQWEREVEIEDGTFPVYYDFDAGAYVEAVVDELVRLDIPRDRIESTISERIQQGEPTEYAHIHVFIDIGVTPAPVSAEP